ncbi:hypothetical protein [Streptomyces sp. NPDC058620]|uniref:hypothetical protein n=1 Tax=Streptomyces sp. NPDC058620 TaxID=3346560 RepID=UPI00365173AD
MPDKTSPLWWLFAAISAAIFLALMFPGMINRRQKAFVACGPVAGFLAAIAGGAVYNLPVHNVLVGYCAALLGLSLGVVGHWKAMRTFQTWKAENPGKPDDEGPGVPWALQIAITFPVFFGAGLWYIFKY